MTTNTFTTAACWLSSRAAPKGLELMLQDYFGVPVKVDQFLGAWYRLDTDDAQCNLDDEQTDSQAAWLSARLWAMKYGTRNRTRPHCPSGPLTLDSSICDFLPTGTAFQPLLKTMVRFLRGR